MKLTYNTKFIFNNKNIDTNNEGEIQITLNKLFFGVIEA